MEVLHYAVANGFRRKGITFAAILGSGLGAALMTALMSLSGGMDREVSDAMSQVAGVLVVTASDAPMVGGILGGGSPLPPEVVDVVASRRYVESVQPAVVTTIPPTVLTTIIPIGAPLRGVDPALDRRLAGPTAHIIAGRSLRSADEVIVGKGLVAPPAGTEAKPIRVGQVIEIPAVLASPLPSGATAAPPPSVTPSPRPTPSASAGPTASAGPAGAARPTGEATRRLQVVGIFETGNSLADYDIVGDIGMVRQVAGLQPGQVTSIAVHADSADHVEALDADLRKVMEARGTSVRITVAKDILGQVNDTLDIVRGFLAFVSVVAAVAGGMSIFVIMLMSVTERTREFGILKAAGWSNGNLLIAVIIESVLLALIGAVIGLGIGYAVALGVNEWLAQDLTVLTGGLIAGILAFGVAMGVLGGMYPATRAARVSPIRSLRAS